MAKLCIPLRTSLQKLDHHTTKLQKNVGKHRFLIQNLNFIKVFLTFPIAGHARPSWAEIRSGPGPVFYLSSYTHHSYRRARARPGPGILSFITIYPSLLLAGILSFITIYPSLLLAGILSFITIYTSLHYTKKKWPVVFLGKIKEYVACKQPNKEDTIQSKLTWEGSK